MADFQTGQWKSGDIIKMDDTASLLPNVSDFDSAMNDFKSSIEDIEYIGSMAELTGGLSEQETQMLETIRSTATTNLTNAVNESTVDIAQTEIAKMVDRGVLQGDIGANIISQVYENAGDTVGEQSRNIESDVAQMGLGIIDKNKQYQMDMWDKQYNVTRDKATGYGEAAGLQLDWQKSESSNALTKELAGMELSAYETAQDKQMWGNLGSSALLASPYLVPTIGKGIKALGSAAGWGGSAAGMTAGGTAAGTAAGVGVGATASGVGAGTAAGSGVGGATYGAVSGAAGGSAPVGGGTAAGAGFGSLAGVGAAALAAPVLGPKITEWGGDFMRSLTGGEATSPSGHEWALAYEQGLGAVPGWEGSGDPASIGGQYPLYGWKRILGEHIPDSVVQQFIDKEITYKEIMARYPKPDDLGH